MSPCLHCGIEVAGGGRFCCAGCEAAYAVVTGLGLDAYYRRRCLDPEAAPLRPDQDHVPVDYATHVGSEADGTRVLHLMVEGLANKQIAQRLGIGEKTIKTHVSRVLAKLGVADRTQAAVLAIREGLVD